jgi:hypothetical protein
VVAETSSADPGLGTGLIRLGAGAAAVATGDLVRVATAGQEWTARLAPGTPTPGTPTPGTPTPGNSAPATPGPKTLARGALVAGLVPGQLLGWSWPDRLRHALALAAGAWAHLPGESGGRDHVDLDTYERLLEAVQVEPQ